MGQRLVITIKRNNADIAALHFHWSAYSVEALYELKKLVNYLEKEEKDFDPVLACLRYVQENGGGINGGPLEAEYKAIQERYPDEPLVTEGYSKSNGLIAITKEGIKNLQSWSQRGIIIHLDDFENLQENEVENFVFFNPFFDDDNNLRIYNPKIDVTSFKIGEIDEVINEVKKVEEGYDAIDYGDTYLSLIM